MKKNVNDYQLRRRRRKFLTSALIGMHFFVFLIYKLLKKFYLRIWGGGASLAPPPGLTSKTLTSRRSKHKTSEHVDRIWNTRIHSSNERKQQKNETNFWLFQPRFSVWTTENNWQFGCRTKSPARSHCIYKRGIPDEWNENLGYCHCSR